MKRSWIGIIVAIVVVGVLAFGAAAAWLFLGALTPEEAVAAVVEKLEGVTTYGFEMSASVETAGQAVEMDFEGVAEEGASLADTRLAMDGTMNLAGQSIGMAEVLTDGRLYLKYSPDPLGNTDQWYYMDFDPAALQSIQAGTNPSEYLDYMQAYSEIEQMRGETIDGVRCNRYHLVIDADKIAQIAVENASAIAEQMPPEVAAQFDPAQVGAMYEAATITMELYLGEDDGMPHRQVITMQLSNPEPMTVTVTMDLSDFGKPVDISAPQGAVPLPVQMGGNPQV